MEELAKLSDLLSSAKELGGMDTGRSAAAKLMAAASNELGSSPLAQDEPLVVGDTPVQQNNARPTGGYGNRDRRAPGPMGGRGTGYGNAGLGGANRYPGGGAYGQVQKPPAEDPKKHAKMVFLKGFRTLSEEDQMEILFNYMSGMDNPLQREKDQFQLTKDKEFFGIKKVAAYSVLGLGVAIILVIVGVFVYISLTQGILSEGSIITSLFMTLQEVLRVIFTSTS